MYKNIFLPIYVFAFLLLATSCKQTQLVTKNEAPAISNKLSSEPNLSTKIPINPEVKKGVLSNGLTYYIKNNPKPENKVELRLVVNAGSILEDEDQLGLAHFLEHMAFNGTKNFKKNELVDKLESIGVKFGAHLNASTGFNKTLYMLPIPTEDSENLDLGFQILEDWAHNLLLNNQDIDEERGVVLEEYRSRRGADMKMFEKYMKKLYYNSKYTERLPIGTKENLETFNYESIKRFYKDWYRPDLMAVIAVGDVDVAVLEAKIKSHFDNIPMPESPKKRETFNIPNHKETFIAIETDKEQTNSSVQIYYKDDKPVKANETEGDYRNGMVKRVFSEMINNRLNELINSENPPFAYGYSYYGNIQVNTKNAYQSFAMSSETGQLEALKALLYENERVRRYGFGQSEMDRAKKNILSRIEKAYKDKGKKESKWLVGELIRNFLNNEPIPGVEWEYNFHKKHLPTININEVNALIKEYIREDNRVVVLTGPEKENLKTVTEVEVRTILDTLKDVELKPYEDTVVPDALMTSLPTSGEIVNTSKDDKLGTKTLELSNGAKVIFKKTDYKNDEILFEAISLGGTSLYSDNDLKKIGKANNGLTEAGINGYSKNDLNKILTGKIANVWPYIGGISEGISGSASPKDIETLFQQIHLYFTKLNKDDKAFASYINKEKAYLGNMLSDPNNYFYIEMNKFIYGKSPRYIGFPTPEMLDNSDYDLAFEKYKERFANAADFNFYFVGNIDEDKLLDYAKKYIASLPSNNTKENYKVFDFRPLSGNHEKAINKGTEPKSFLQFIYQGETQYNSKEALAFKSLGDILDIKLTEILREKEGGVYSMSVSASFSKTPYGWYSMYISIPCGPENVEKLKQLTLAEIDRLIKEGPSEKDLSKVKEAQLLERKENLKRNRFWIRTLKRSYLDKIDTSEIFEFEEKVNSLTVKNIQDIAKKYLTKGFILGIRNPETNK